MINCVDLWLCWAGPLPTCSQNSDAGVEWPTTAANTVFVQKCPGSFDHGEVRRLCRLMDSSKTKWDEPDYSNCHSQTFLDIRMKVSNGRVT